MIDVLLVCDNLNPRGGSFMTACRDDIVNFFSGKPHRLKVINSPDITSKNIYDNTINLTSQIFVPYCHGNQTCLANAIPEIFISTTENIGNFSNSFFYTFSCSSGHTLGEDLIKNGCKSFFGYKNTIWNIDGYNQFMECANYGLYLFIDGVNTDAIIKEMIRLYNEKIDELTKINSMVASHLRYNRDALVKLGDNITISDIIV